MYDRFNRNNQQNNQENNQQSKPPTYMINPHNKKPFDPNNIYDTNNPFSIFYVKDQQPGKGLAITSLVLGIISFFLMRFHIVSVAIGLLGILFASLAPSRGCKGGIQAAGLVLSIIGTTIGVLATIAFISYSVGTNSNWSFHL